MSEVTEVSTAVEIPNGGKIVFADDVIATIAALAAADVEGIAGMSGSVVGEWTEKLGGKKNITKGIKVEVGEEETAIDVYVNVKYGYRIQQVCTELQKAIKNAVETMTGLRVVECNVNVQAVVTIIVGVLFVVVGNYLPKCRQNRSIGIRIPWTLKNEKVWNKTHRLGGITGVIGGSIMIAGSILGMLMPEHAFAWSFGSLIPGLLLTVAVPTVYSFALYRRLKKEGNL